MNGWATAGYAILLWAGMLVVMRIFGGNVYTDQVVRAVTGLLVSAGFAARLGRLTEVRWGILLAVVFIFSVVLLWVNDFFIIGYFVWASHRLSKSRAETAGDDDREIIVGRPPGGFFVRIRLWELALWAVLSLAAGLAAGFWSGWLWLADDKPGFRVFEYVFDGLLAFWLLGKLEGAGVDLDGFIGGWPKGRLIGEGLLVTLALWMFGSGAIYGLVYGIAGFNTVLAERALHFLAWKPTMDRWWLEEFTTIVLVGPIIEEMIFRGVVLRRMAAIRGNTAAIVASSVLFGLLHGWELAPAMTVSGIGLSIMYARSQTLMVPIIMHIANNLAAYLTAAYNPGGAPVTLAQLQAEMSWLLIWAGVATAVLASYFYRYWPRGEGAWPQPGKNEGEKGVKR